MVLSYVSCDQTILFSSDHSQFSADFIDRFLCVKAQNDMEKISFSDSIFGDNLQSSTEQNSPNKTGVQVIYSLLCFD